MFQSQLRFFVANQRRWFRASEIALILLAVAVGLCAGVLTNIQSATAHAMHSLFYGVRINRLSALVSIHHPLRLLALPLGGVILGVMTYAMPRRKHAPIDVVEANALHGGRIPLYDSLLVSAQTLISNGTGASVGLEAAYAQLGGGMASVIGQWVKLRRNDLRTLVGAGAGAAVGAAFGAPLTGTFYAFEIVIGTYTPAAIAPVAAAALAATLVTRGLGVEPYLIASQNSLPITTVDYSLFAALGLICAGIGISIMRLVTWTERQVKRSFIPAYLQPLVGGLLLIPIAWTSPQSLSAGHGALRLDLVLHLSVQFLAAILALKIAASIISLSFGFRGGLFFAALFLGSLVGQIFAELVNMAYGAVLIDPNNAALVGMAALAVSIVGGPMTLSLLVLEVTHDFALTGTVITAALCASALTRAQFGYSFSTWRLHVRGANIRSARDIGWVKSLTAERMMRRLPMTVPETMSIAEFREHVPLGSTSRVILSGPDHNYCGIVTTAAAYASELDSDAPITTLAHLVDHVLTPEMAVDDVLRAFEDAEADDLAVVNASHQILGILTEKHVHRRYLEESEKSQRAVFGE